MKTFLENGPGFESSSNLVKHRRGNRAGNFENLSGETQKGVKQSQNQQFFVAHQFSCATQRLYDVLTIRVLMLQQSCHCSHCSLSS